MRASCKKLCGWLAVGGIAASGCLVASGCAGSLKPALIDAAYHKPSNVAVFFAVNDDDGEPVADLLASDFNIYEDDKLVSRDESRQTIVNPELAAAHYTLLLVDMSASVTESDQLGRIVSASQEFITRVEPYQRTAVYAFDGSPTLYEVAPFSENEQRAQQGLTKLQQFQSRDPSTNLNGAIVQALDKLKQSLKQSKAPLHFGTLVVFTDGTDRAARVPLQQTLDSIGASETAVFAIGVGNEIDDATLSRIGKDGYIRVENSTAVSDAFKQIGDRIVRYTRRYYLLSYCSPARAGNHKVTVEAAGFAPGCDATKPPPFDTTGRSWRSRKKLGLTPEPAQAQASAPKPAAKAKSEAKAEASTEVKAEASTAPAAEPK